MSNQTDHTEFFPESHPMHRKTALARAALTTQFWSKVREALAVALEVIDGPRNVRYNAGGVSILDKWPRGLHDVLAFVWTKVSRATAMANSQQATTPEFADTCIDLINYSAFLMAYASTMLNTGKEGCKLDDFER